MLTSDLARAQVRQDALMPRWIDPAKASLRDDAAELIARFQAHVGRTAGALDEAIADFAALRTDVVLMRGLAKLLWDRATTGTPELRSAHDEVVTPSAIRQAVFRTAGASWPVRPGGEGGFADRAAVIAAAATSLGIAIEAVDAGLYADLADEQRVLTFDAPTPEALLAGYNVALAQACLLRAREVRITLPAPDPKRVRALLRELKFRRLLFRAERGDDTVRLTLDGPLSLFKQTSRYGLQLALLLPALTRTERWSLEADVLWSRGATRDRPVVLRLDQDSPLAATGRDKGVWTSAEEAHFIKNFDALKTPWRLAAQSQVLDLDGRDVLVPDFTLSHSDGRVALLDLVFAWRKQSFMKRLSLLGEVGPKHLVIALADKGALDDEALPADLMVYRFKGVISPKRVIELAEKVAIRGPRDARGAQEPTGAKLTPKRRGR